MLSPKPSTASTRPRSSIGVDHDAHARPSSSPRSNGSTGSTTAGCWNPSATSRRPKPRSATTPCWMSQPGPRDSNETASDQPGAVQGAARGRPIDRAYIELFLQQHRGDIRGDVLEIGDNRYTLRFGEGRVRKSVI